MSDCYFHFTLGPVQGFVSQARRTRDFWGGSFLLSWLSGCAMLAVKKQGGEIIFPQADDAYIGWIEGVKNENTPRQGNIPNRFKAKVNADFSPQLVVDTVNAAWQALAQKIWDEDLESIANEETRKIWDRQHQAFWEIAWAQTEDENDSSLLDRVKNWRTHLSPDEPGVKCMMMDGWQELSAATGPGKGVKTFWDDVRARGKKGMCTDLREGEHLCAIAFVKRRFARYFEQVSMDMPGGWKLQGWVLEAGVPSVQYMAAARWLEAAYRKGDTAAAAAFHRAANALTHGYGEWETDLQCLRDFSNKGEGKRLTSLDGGVFFESLLENRNLWEDALQAEKVKKLLGMWRRTAQLDPVSPFYAILLMDGDSLGKQMSDLGKQTSVSNALNGFTSGVSIIVDAHSGFLIYAGGDDVLAVLPMEDAFSCALDLRKAYLSEFRKAGIDSTLSGAIEFVHIKMPLGKVLGDAHQLLDGIAKEKTGRDAIACRVWKPGGMALEWAMPWEKAVSGEDVILEEIVKHFRSEDEKVQDEGQFASRFFYRIRERFDLLNPPKNSKDDPVLTDEEAVELMTMEYLNSGDNRDKLAIDRAREKIDQLLQQCRHKVRYLEGKEYRYRPSTTLAVDGALLVRFLAHKGIER